MPFETRISSVTRAYFPKRNSTSFNNELKLKTVRHRAWSSLLSKINTEIKLLGLVVLVTEGMLSLTLPFINPPTRPQIVFAMVGLIGLVVVSVVLICLVRSGLVLPKQLREEQKPQVVEENNLIIAGASEPALSANEAVSEIQQLRQVLFQAPRYSIPTYYLDGNLNVIDWNVAFELIFKPILHKFRLRHVNYFIVELANWKQVFDHARDFTEIVKEGELPLIDMEPVVYHSAAYGTVEFEKIACQLTDANADLKAWAVGLMIKCIDWQTFSADLLPRLKEHKLWSIYAVSYDAVLRDFPPYRALIEEVLNGIPSQTRRVLELGAGTGNVTHELLKRGHQVTAVENNQPMLEKMFAKRLGPSDRLVINKNSIHNLEALEDRSFDAVVAVNVLYALDDPAACIRNVARLLKRGDMFVLSTTHSDTDLEPLLSGIKQHLKENNQFDTKEVHYRRVHDINKNIELTIARRYAREDYEEWLREAGFEIVYNQTSYLNAVIVIHARRK